MWGNITSILIALIGFGGMCVTAFFSVRAIVVSKEKQHNIDIEQENRSLKVEVYKKWSAVLGELLTIGHNPLEVAKMIDDFCFECSLYASPNVIEAVVQYRITEDLEKMFAAESILFKIREELGLNNGNLKKGDLFKVLVRDSENVDELLKQVKKSSG